MVSFSATLAALLGRAGKSHDDASINASWAPTQRGTSAFKNDFGRSETVIQAGTIQSVQLPHLSGGGEAVQPWRDYWHPDTTGAGFVGREQELDQLAKALASGEDIARIQSIQGMAGVGKTELAVAYVHRNKHRFDGRVFFDFQSYAADRLRVTAEQALARMLPTIAGLAPEEVERLSGMQLLSVWHSVTANRRLLMVWDNVKHPDQVRPLLVRNDGCASIIISRDTIAVNSWESPVWLDVLSERDAVDLARQILGGDPPEADVLRLVRGNLYVPVLIASHSRAVRGGAMSLGEVLAELPETPHDVDQGSQRDLFERLDGSYFNLDPEQRLAFRMIGSHPGTFATLDALSTVLNLEIQRTRELMDGLIQAGLLTRVHHGEDFEDLAFRSYNCHDLLRSYAAHRARQEVDGELILDALVDHYQARLNRYSESDQRWFLLESNNIRDTALAGESSRHVRLAESLGWLAYDLRQHGIAVTAFQHAMELLSEDPHSHELAMVRLGLGNIALARGDYELAVEYYGFAAAGFLSTDDQYSYATAQRGLAYAMQGRGFSAEAFELLEDAKGLFAQIGRLDLAAAITADILAVAHDRVVSDEEHAS